MAFLSSHYLSLGDAMEPRKHSWTGSLLGDPIPACEWITTWVGGVQFSPEQTWSGTFTLHDHFQSQLAFRLSGKCAPNLTMPPSESVNYLTPHVVKSIIEMINKGSHSPVRRWGFMVVPGRRGWVKLPSTIVGNTHIAACVSSDTFSPRPSRWYCIFTLKLTWGGLYKNDPPVTEETCDLQDLLTCSLVLNNFHSTIIFTQLEEAR